jgi:hypothetical protein
MYITKAIYLDLVFVEGTLKDDLCDKWKKLKQEITMKTVLKE